MLPCIGYRHIYNPSEPSYTRTVENRVVIFAFQIPDSRLQPSHRVLDELAAATVDGLDDFLFSSSFRTVRVPRNEVDIQVYHTLFSSLMDDNNNNNDDGKSCDSNRTNNTKDNTTTKHDTNDNSNNNIAIWTTTYCIHCRIMHELAHPQQQHQ